MQQYILILLFKNIQKFYSLRTKTSRNTIQSQVHLLSNLLTHVDTA